MFFLEEETALPANASELAFAAFWMVTSSAGCGSRSDQDEAHKVGDTDDNRFMTDFGAANDAVAICKAVILGIAPDARIMDITHQVTPFSIEEGARFRRV